MGLRPAILDDLGILATINWYCREFQRIYPIRIEKHIEIQEEGVPKRLKTDIYRILQEGLNNVAKHSHANLVILSLRNTENKIELIIKDNGTGFDPDDLSSSEISGRGLGLRSMRERTEISGGVFSISSAKGRGTTIRASWSGEEGRPI